MKNNWLNTNRCTGCSACADKCPVNAIRMAIDETGCLKPEIDAETCVTCYLCKKICPNFNQNFPFEYEDRSYIAYYTEKKVEKLSSSGGAFAAFAKQILKNGGIVYGASMQYKKNRLYCSHIRIENEKNLFLIQGSKYVQSRTEGIYKKVKQDLDSGKTVLFSGTSCQISSLRNYISNSDKLIAVDLVCHGVPKDRIFQDYVKFVENKLKTKVTDISFRSKKHFYHGKILPYVLTLKCEDAKKGIFTHTIIRPKSAFFSLFMSRAGYRHSCYNCNYATLKKPSDITLGDFRPSYSEIIQYGLNRDRHYSSIIVHTQKGQKLLESLSDLISCEISTKEMLSHHLNLQHPSVISKEGEKLYGIYLKYGFNMLQRYVEIRYTVENLKWVIKTLLRKIYEST